MSKIAISNDLSNVPTSRMSWLDRAARAAVHKALDRLRGGVIHLEEPGGPCTLGHRDATEGLSIRAVIDDPRSYRALLFGGTIGAGEAYMDGWWDCKDLTSLVRLLLRNRGTLDAMERGWARLAAPWRVLGHWVRRNDRRGARRNIAAHYDLGNDFFAEFLDETMTYSSGIFEHTGMTLADASVAKLDRLCRKLALCADDHVLEIGSGWGSFALHAAGRYGCRVTTTTISRQQHAETRRRVRQAGLEDRVTALCRDYRDLDGCYDKMVSIEMIEAVGHQFYDLFFDTCARLLAPHGLLALQAITITDAHYEQSRREVDFIKRHVFPGCCIPSITALLNSATRASDLRLFHLEDMTPHYAETLRRWRQRFIERIDAIRALGYSDSLLRMWEFYLCYCEGSFEERFTGSVQMVLTRPQCLRPPIMAAMAAD